MIYSQYSEYNEEVLFRSEPCFWPLTRYEHIRIAWYNKKDKSWICEMNLLTTDKKFNKRWGGPCMYQARICKTKKIEEALVWVDQGQIWKGTRIKI
jgi:hypothetical protein